MHNHLFNNLLPFWVLLNRKISQQKYIQAVFLENLSFALINFGHYLMLIMFCLYIWGQIQAEYTGKRLKELNLPYTEVIQSTMTRAQETGSIISKFLPEVNCLLVTSIYLNEN